MIISYLWWCDANLYIMILPSRITIVQLDMMWSILYLLVHGLYCVHLYDAYLSTTITSYRECSIDFSSGMILFSDSLFISLFRFFDFFLHPYLLLYCIPLEVLVTFTNHREQELESQCDEKVENFRWAPSIGYMPRMCTQAVQYPECPSAGTKSTSVTHKHILVLRRTRLRRNWGVWDRPR